jgi:hypothetical protein
MSITHHLCIWSAFLLPLAAIGQDEPRMSLEDRVAAAKPIVVGKLDVLPGGKHGSCEVTISDTLFGAIPTNKTLVIRYNSSSWLVPGMAPPMKRGQSYICFVTDDAEPQNRGAGVYVTRAVGKNGSYYAHDGFELATDDMLGMVRALIAKKNKRREGA